MGWPKGVWPLARDTAGELDGLASVVWFGDSLTAGSRCSDFRRRSMVGRVAAGLQARWGDGGDGFRPHLTGSPGGGVLSGTGTSSTAFTTDVPNGHVVTLASGGTDLRWEMDDVRGSTIVLYLRRGSGQAARWRVDGGSWVAVDCSGSGCMTATVTDLDPTVGHLVEVEPTSGTIGIAGVEGRNPTGIRVHQVGLGGRTTRGNTFSSLTGENSGAFRTLSIGTFAPDLLVVALGVNDSDASTPTNAADYETAIADMITKARTATPNCDVVLVAHHLGAFDDNDYDGLVAKLYSLADTYGAVVVDLDLWARTPADGSAAIARHADPADGTSWGAWNTWGWWASFTTFGPSGSDPVHPGDTGHLVLAQILLEVLSA